jgi:hypothetical protein
MSSGYQWCEDIGEVVMRKYLGVLVLSCVLLIGLAGVASAQQDSSPVEVNPKLTLVFGSPPPASVDLPTVFVDPQFQSLVTPPPEASTVPEPSTVLLMGLGLVGLIGFRRWKNRKESPVCS